MTPDPWLSILLPVFDVGPVLDECLESILEQAMPGVELILVDDASTGDDAARLTTWQARHPDQVRVLTHPVNRGVASTRNTLLAEARGTYLWFVDPDDRMERGALAALKTIVEASRPDLVMCDFRTFGVDDESRGGRSATTVRRAHVRTFEGRSNELSHSREALVAGLFRTGQLHPWSKIVRRDAWPASLRFPDGRVFEDLAVYPRVALAARTHFHAPQVWISYRQSERSILATLDERKLDDWTLALTGFARDLDAASLRPDADLLFEVSHFCARTLLRAIRRQRRLPVTSMTRQRLRVYCQRWRESSPLDAASLRRAYWSRGMIGRWMQWRWTVYRLGMDERVSG